MVEAIRAYHAIHNRTNQRVIHRVRSVDFANERNLGVNLNVVLLPWFARHGGRIHGELRCCLIDLDRRWRMETNMLHPSSLQRQQHRIVITRFFISYVGGTEDRVLIVWTLLVGCRFCEFLVGFCGAT